MDISWAPLSFIVKIMVSYHAILELHAMDEEMFKSLSHQKVSEIGFFM